MYMRFLGIGIGHCGQHPTETDIGASDGNDSDSLCMENGEERDGNATEEDNDAQDDEDEGTDLEEYGDSDDDLGDDDDLGYDNL